MNRIVTYISWYLKARTAYSLHSPMLYSFCEEVLEDDRWYYAFDTLKNITKKSPSGHITLPVPTTPSSAGDTGQDFHHFQRTSPRSFSDVQGQMLFRLSVWWKPRQIIVIGDEIALQTAYLAQANTSTPLIAVSSSEKMNDGPPLLWKHLGLSHIQIESRPASQLLDISIQPEWERMLLFVNTTDENSINLTELLNHLSDSCSRPWIVIFDGIHRTKETSTAWKTWSDGRYAGAWIDLFHSGIWISDKAFIEPIALRLIHRKYKPFRLGWI